jgi:ATP-dependent Lhr-like helicase
MSLLERIETRPVLPEPFEKWFAARGWVPRAHQLDLLAKAQAGRSTLLIAPTGAGKTLAGFLPTLVELYEARRRGQRTASSFPSPLAGEVDARSAAGGG